MYKKKISKIVLTDVHAADGWPELIHELKFEQFEKEHPDLEEDELIDKFNEEVLSEIFEYGEFANLEIIVDEDLHIVGGNIIPFNNKEKE